MSETTRKFYLTTPIYYVNARPHIGHAYSTIAADVIARRHRLLVDDTFFLTGTDEHGQKVQRSAAAAGIPPQQFTDEVSASFHNLWKRMGLTNDDFIRTTDERHKRGVQHLWRVLEANGAIYLSSYTGAYCVSDEAFVDLPAGTPCPDCGRPLETVTEENYFFKLSAYADKIIQVIESGQLHIQPDTVRNEVLSFVRGGLKDLSISRTTFDWGIPVPGNPKHVVYVWLDALVNYITAIGYGAEDRDDLTPEQKQSEKAKFEKYWPADIHLVGKEITRFHCVYWPAFLMAAGLPLPKSVVANGWLLFEESKMSKSRGNVVRTETILDAFGPLCPPKPTLLSSRSAAEGSASPEAPQPPSKADQDLFAADVLRYFLLREIPFGQDGTFSFDALITRYNADLANGYGNLVSRTLNLVSQSCGGTVPKPNPFEQRSFVMEGSTSLSFSAGTPSGIHTVEGPLLAEQAAVLCIVYERAFRELLFTSQVDETSGQVARAGVINSALGLVAITDGLLTQKAPWKLAKSSDAAAQSDLRDTLYTAAESIRIITALLYPILPYATASVWQQLGLGSIEQAARDGELKDLKWGGLKPGTKLGPLAPIFPRADKGLAQIMTDMENPVPSSSPEPAAASVPTPEALNAVTPATTTEAASTHNLQLTTNNSELISIDDFAKVDLRVAQIVVAERIPKADKLLRLEVDLGPNFPRRQILAGIAEHYTPESLIGRKVVIVANLAPRKMRGLESQGMVVAASIGPAGAPVLAGFLEDVELGARLK